MKTIKLTLVAAAALFAGAFTVFAGAAEDFDAALKAAKPLSAEAAYLKLTKSGAQTAAIRHFQAAKVADALGKETLRKDRLMLFVREEKGWKPEVEEALWFLVMNEGEVEHFVRLAANSPASQVLWQSGYDMLTKLVDANRPAEVIRLADILMAKYPDPSRRQTVLNWLRESSQRMGEGYPERDLVDLLMKYDGLGELRDFETIVRHGNHRKAFQPDFVIRYAIKYNGAVADSLLAEQLSWLDDDKMQQLKEADKIRERDDRLATVRQVKKVCFDGKHWESSYRYMRLATVRYPKQFFKTVETNGYAAGACKMFRDVQSAMSEDSKKSGHWVGQVRWTLDQLLQSHRINAQEIAQIVDADPGFYSTDLLLNWSPLGNVREASDKAKNTDAIRKLAQKYPKQADAILGACIHRFANEKEGAGDAGMLRRLFLAAAKNNWNLDYGWTIDPVVNGCGKSMNVGQKVELLKSGYTITGYNGAWKEFKRRVDNEKDPKSFYADPAVKGFAGTIREDALPGDPMLKVARLLSDAKNLAAVEAVVPEFKKAYPSKYGEAASARDNEIARYFFFDKYWGPVSNGKPEECARFVELAVEKLSAKWSDRSIINHCAGRAGKADLWLRVRQAYAAVDGTHDALAEMTVAKDSEKPFDGIDMKKMKPANACRYFINNFNNLKAPARYKLYGDYIASRPVAEQDPEGIYWVTRIASEHALTAKVEPNKEVLDRFPLEKVEEVLFAKPYANFSWDAYDWLFGAAFRTGKQAEAVKRFCAWAETREPRDRYQALAWLLTRQIYTPKSEKQGDHWDFIVDDKTYVTLVKGALQQAINAIPLSQAPTVNFEPGNNRLRGLLSAASKEETKDDSAVAAVKGVWSKQADLILAGARNTEGVRDESNIWNMRLADALAAGDAVKTARAARRAGQSVYTHYIGDKAAGENIEAFKKNGYNEALYLYVDAFPTDLQEWLIALGSKERAAIASSLPGIYPVPETDPSYPLYVAADELSKKNPERAWQILSETKNQPVFEREILKIPPDFAIWGVEQLRLARGNKDALLLKARQIATAVIAQESKVAPELVAAMMLSRAEGYRDQQNFEAAKLEYQSIRDNPTYHATKYGKKAMFRAIDLQIVSGNAQGVEATLEYWLSQNDREIQAQAHYFMARLAYDRKDYDECIAQLRKVFAIDYTHTEARFLQGEWKLATNSEVDDTEVLVGKLGDRNLIKPGAQFSITVQDSNLSVAGGGASIPVLVKSEPGKDCELVNLYPSSRDPSSFKGIVEVVLGKANPSNRVLEVRGDDTVTYVIDPAFLKERGLPLNEPKVLHVIDDGKLALGAGAPKTETKRTERDLNDILGEGADSNAGPTRKLRPGNPLYIAVQDRDCSHGEKDEKVSVSVETSSGDRLDNFELTETKPFSGVFRGKVTTSLPPPRAFASDTAAGFEPGDVINEKKTAGWKSLSDGQPGKWFEVDTMGSYLFSEISLATPSAADIKAVKLVGRMGSRVFNLGQMPAGVVEMKLGLWRQHQYDNRSKRALDSIRAFCETDRAERPRRADKISFTPLHKHNGYQPETAFFRGPFVVPSGVDTFRLRLVQKSSKKDALRHLWVSLAIDGEEVFSGQGCQLQDMLIAPDVTAGCHQFEFAVFSGHPDDAFDLLWEPVGEAAKPFPYAWFQADGNPALKDFVKDLATIVKTNDGFRATFAKPVRLRSFRWEFADVKSPDVTVTRIAAKDEKGEKVLPVASDFTDARSNKTLEVAPGDKITVVYEDSRTTSGDKKVVQRQIDSSFNDAKVRFVFEDEDLRGHPIAQDAFRFQPGDALVLAVQDPDCDTSDEADVLEVEIRNSDGKTITKKLVEYWPKWLYGRDESDVGMHSGVFMGVLRTCRAGDTNASDKVWRVKDDDCITVSYNDRENTDPGVPCVRTARIFAARPATPSMTLFDVAKAQEVDNSAEGRIRLDRIRRRPGNENVTVVYRDVLTAVPMEAAALEGTNAIPVNVGAGAIPVRVNDRSRARHAGSKILLNAIAHSEIEKAAAEKREAESITVPLKLGASMAPLRITKGSESVKEAQNAGTFSGLVQLSLGPIDPNIEVPEDAPPVLCVTGSDLVDLEVLDEKGNVVIRKTVKLVANGSLALTDSTFMGERTSAHVGESFFVVVDDADRDATEDPDRIEAEVASSKTGVKRKMFLTETMPHSGVFSGRLRPVMFAPGETIPSVSTGGVATANEILTEERFAVGYGDKVIFRYKDGLTLPGTPARTLTATGTVFRGSNGDVRLYSKRFSDRDMAVLVQFRLAECLFEQAKEHRKLKQPEKSTAAIAEGKIILEEALKNYPDSAHVVQGEYLLANLYQELATEQKNAGDEAKAAPLYQEALSRFAQILGTWPDSEYAARSQYHKALCLEMLKDYGRASEEYVKMTYLYPESELVGEATIRLATYYYTKEKRFDIAGHIYRNFQQRFPQHEKAARALFMAGSCYIKQAEKYQAEYDKLKDAKKPIPRGLSAHIPEFYRDAIRTFDKLVSSYQTGSPQLKAQALYWAGDVCVRRQDWARAYQYLKRTIFEFPETEWARRARGLLLQESYFFKDFD